MGYTYTRRRNHRYPHSRGKRKVGSRARPQWPQEWMGNDPGCQVERARPILRGKQLCNTTVEQDRDAAGFPFPDQGAGVTRESIYTMYILVFSNICQPTCFGGFCQRKLHSPCVYVCHSSLFLHLNSIDYVDFSYNSFVEGKRPLDRIRRRASRLRDQRNEYHIVIAKPKDRREKKKGSIVKSILQCTQNSTHRANYTYRT